MSEKRVRDKEKPCKNYVKNYKATPDFTDTKSIPELEAYDLIIVSTIDFKQNYYANSCHLMKYKKFNQSLTKLKSETPKGDPITIKLNAHEKTINMFLHYIYHTLSLNDHLLPILQANEIYEPNIDYYLFRDLLNFINTYNLEDFAHHILLHLYLDNISSDAPINSIALAFCNIHLYRIIALASRRGINKLFTIYSHTKNMELPFETIFWDNLMRCVIKNQKDIIIVSSNGGKFISKSHQYDKPFMKYLMEIEQCTTYLDLILYVEFFINNLAGYNREWFVNILLFFNGNMLTSQHFSKYLDKIMLATDVNVLANNMVYSNICPRLNPSP